MRRYGTIASVKLDYHETKNSMRQKRLSQKINQTLIEYLKTQFLLMSIMTAIAWATFSLLGVKYSVLLAFVTGAFSTIPLVGMIISAGLSSAVAIFDNARFLSNLPEIFEGLAILGIYVLFNFVADTFLLPYLASKVFRVHPLAVFFSVIVGSAFFGVIGAFFAVPVLLVIITIQRHRAGSA